MIVEVFGGGDILSPVEVKKTKKKKHHRTYLEKVSFI